MQCYALRVVRFASCMKRCQPQSCNRHLQSRPNLAGNTMGDLTLTAPLSLGAYTDQPPVGGCEDARVSRLLALRPPSFSVLWRMSGSAERCGRSLAQARDRLVRGRAPSPVRSPTHRTTT